MAVGSPPTVRRRQLGRELRGLREQHGMLAEDLAEKLRCSASRVSRIETARIRIAPGTVHEILDILEVHGAERARLVKLAREADEQGWWQEYTDRLTYEYSTYIALESEAATLRVFQPALVYGVLQTERYVRAVMEQGASLRSASEVEAKVQARLGRQPLLQKAGAPDVHVVFDEAVLHHVIGDRDILRSQLHHLVGLSRLPNLTIQVLPFSSADLLAFVPGSMVIMTFPDQNDGPVVYLESMGGDLYIERPEIVQRYVSLYERLSAQALSPKESLAMIESLAKTRRSTKRTSLPAAR